MNSEELGCYVNWRDSPIPMPGGGEAAVGAGGGSGKRRDCRGAAGQEDSARGVLGRGEGRAVFPIQTQRNQVHVQMPTGLTCGIRGFIFQS